MLDGYTVRRLDVQEMLRLESTESGAGVEGFEARR